MYAWGAAAYVNDFPQGMRYTDVAAGAEHACAVQRDGVVDCSGISFGGGLALARIVVPCQ